MALSLIAEDLLEFHSRDPQRLIYGSEVLGTTFRTESIPKVDAAYRELEDAGLATKTGVVIGYFGEEKELYRLTARGIALAQEHRNARVQSR
ncbi:MAG: hypothetical protein WD768_14930 [Phycisphaeraceae bacterium]